MISCLLFLTPSAMAEEQSVSDHTVTVSCVTLENGQVLYSKYAETDSEIRVKNESDKGCLIVVFRDYYNIYDDSEDGEIFLKFFVAANSSATVSCPKGTYNVRAVFGENYYPRPDNYAEYAMMTGRFARAFGDYIVITGYKLTADRPLDITVSTDDAEAFDGTIPYIYYISQNHAWVDEHANERIGADTSKLYLSIDDYYYIDTSTYPSDSYYIFDDEFYLYRKTFSNGYFEPF